MAIKKQLPLKHRTKKITEEQGDEIGYLRAFMAEEKEGPVTFLEAKHEYFEAKEKDIGGKAFVVDSKD